MSDKVPYNGFAIALAWPETYCKQPGAWYDPVTRWLGINKYHYYKAGHAALVLIDNKNQKCHYFDFGRYHTPFKHGRVRSVDTDHDLNMKIKPNISCDGKIILNFREILIGLQKNKACHGEGELHASYSKINFERAFKKAKHMQKISPIPYGPFRYQGSNCSRFVNTVIRYGRPCVLYKIKLNFFVPLTPTPLNNVNALQHKTIMPKLLKGEAFCPIRKLDRQLLQSTLQPPEKNNKIPHNAQWLGGEGAGSWFVFEINDSMLHVTRYSPEGVVECKGLYENNEQVKIADNSFTVTYPSNCKVVYLKYNNKEVKFIRSFI